MSVDPGYREFLRRVVRDEARPAHKFGHQPRLYALCEEIGAGLAADDDVIFAAVWLHDLGVFEGNRPEELTELARWDHVAYAVRRGTELLRETDFPEAKIARVARVIEEHQPKDTPSSVEATIVRDADILEQLGATTVMRTAAKLGSDTRFHRFADVQRTLERQVDSLPGQLRLERARTLAEPRVRALRSFLQSLAAETGADPG